MPSMHPDLPPRSRGELFLTAIIIVLAFIAAWGLALLVLTG